MIQGKRSNQTTTLSAPAQYFPPVSGQFEVSAGLSRLGKDFGNGEADRQVFQLDDQWQYYRQQKLASRQEDLDKYYINLSADNALRAKLVHRMMNTLVLEHPRHFRSTELPLTGNRILNCQLSREAIAVDGDGELLDITRAKSASAPIPEYEDAIDALASQLQEDIAVVQFNERAGDRLVLLHLCFPNHWSAEDKIGKGFNFVHSAVPHFEKLTQQSEPFLKSLTTRGPFVRFAWGLATDQRLNHHPVPPSEVDIDVWRGRGFSDPSSEIYLRIERQVLFPIPEHQAFMFTIRTYFRDVTTLNEEQRRCLFLAASDMDEASARYKGLYDDREKLVARLGAGLPMYQFSQDF